MVGYKLVYGSQLTRPLEKEINVDTVYLRKNIEKVTKQDENGNPYEIWQYLEKQMTLREFALMQLQGE